MSMEIFKWPGARKVYFRSFDVYYALIDKLGATGMFKVIDRLLIQMKEEGIGFKDSLFVLIMKYNGRAGLPLFDIYKNHINLNPVCAKSRNSFY